MGRYLFKTTVFLAFFLGMTVTVINFGDRIIPNIGEKTYKIVTIEPLLKTERTISSDLPIIKIGDETVYYPEFEFYLLATKKDYESLLGDRVWKVTQNGRSIEELLKTDIIEEIARLKIVINEARREGHNLSDAEVEEIKKTAKDQLKGIDPVLKAGYYLDEELITRIYVENFLATKFFNFYSKKVGLEGEEAKEQFNKVYNIWESMYTADIYWENIDGINMDKLEIIWE